MQNGHGKSIICVLFFKFHKCNAKLSTILSAYVCHLIISNGSGIIGFMSQHSAKDQDQASCWYWLLFFCCLRDWANLFQQKQSTLIILDVSWNKPCSHSIVGREIVFAHVSGHRKMWLPPGAACHSQVLRHWGAALVVTTHLFEMTQHWWSSSFKERRSDQGGESVLHRILSQAFGNVQ